MRLIDILTSTKPQSPLATILKGMPCFVVDNVAEFYYHHKKEFWRMQDFPHPRPPFERMWIEFKIPHTFYSDAVGIVDVKSTIGTTEEAYFGCTIEAVPIEQMMSLSIKKDETREIAIHLSDHWYQFHGEYFYVDTVANKLMRSGRKLDGFGTVRHVEFRFRLNEDDACVEVCLVPPSLLHLNTDDFVANYTYCSHPAFMALSFLQCRNSETIEVRVSDKLQARRKQRGKPPLSPYHMVRVLPMDVHQQKIRRVYLGDPVDVSLRKDLSMRRGSYASYGEKYGHGKLFGKYEGVYWRPGVVKDPSVPYKVDVKEPKVL